MHRIHRQVFEVDLHGGEQAGFEVQRRISAACSGAAGAPLESALDALDAGSRHRVIERLDVDLGVVGLQELEDALTTSLPLAVSSALKESGHDRGSTDALGGGGVPSLDDTEALIAAVSQFLRQGTLPWWYAGDDPISLEQRL